MSKYQTWYHPYTPSKEFNKKVAYFSMEFAIDQSLKTYSGGLGFLAGSHMRSAYELRQNVIGIGMLWKYGYYDQGRNLDQTLQVQHIEKNYNFLEDTGIKVNVRIIDNKDVVVKAWVLKPEVFGTVPIYYLSTDNEENDFLSKTITHHLYDPNELTRIAQSMVLGIGGAKVVQALGGADIYHLNEGHGLPAFYYLRDFYPSIEEAKNHFVFTTHTPEKAGNEERDAQFLNRMGFYGNHELNEEQITLEAENGMLNYTLAALRHAKIANAVSQLHGVVSNEMWKDFDRICKIIAITNAQNTNYWIDKSLHEYYLKKDSDGYINRKKELKKEFFKVVADQTGKILDPDVLTIVWARRFAGYKRADLLMKDLDIFHDFAANSKFPVQIIWAGKPYPKDQPAIDIFNKIVLETKKLPNCTILTGYELALSKLLKTGSDIWLNNPRITREASGTSGMTAAMNGSLNISINDGWIPEFQEDGVNTFLIPSQDHTLPVEIQDQNDFENLYKVLNDKALPTYYDKPDKWLSMIWKAKTDVLREFNSHRMATQYYQLLYN